MHEDVRAVFEVLEELAEIIHVERKRGTFLIGADDLDLAGLGVEMKGRSVPCGVMKHGFTPSVKGFRRPATPLSAIGEYSSITAGAAIEKSRSDSSKRFSWNESNGRDVRASV